MKGFINALLFGASIAASTDQNSEAIGRGTGKTLHYGDMDATDTGIPSHRPKIARREGFTPSVGNFGDYESFTTRCGRVMYRNRTKMLEKRARHLSLVELWQRHEIFKKHPKGI